MKKFWLAVSMIALVVALIGVPYLVEGIAERGAGGVNYGRVIFPLLVSAIAFWRFRKHNLSINEYRHE